MFHLLYRDRPMLHGMGIFSGIHGYTKPDDLEKISFTRKKGEVTYRGKVRGTGIVFEETASIEGGRIRVRIRRDGAWPKDTWGGFQINLPVADYGGAEYLADGHRFVFPAEYSKSWKFPDRIKRLECHLGNSSRNVVFEYADGLSL